MKSHQPVKRGVFAAAIVGLALATLNFPDVLAKKDLLNANTTASAVAGMLNVYHAQLLNGHPPTR